MATEPTRIAILFQRYADKTASPEEIRELFELAAGGSFDQELNELLTQRLIDTDSADDYDYELWAGVLAKVKDDIEAIELPVAPTVEAPKKKKFGFARFAVAAAVATIIFGAGLFYFNQGNQAPSSQQVKVQDVAPGKEGATLTLASGKKIRLADAANGELAKEAGVVISKTADGQVVYEIQSSTSENKINTISTAKGETYRLRLPDGSLVWLNAASSLTYSANLIDRGGRRVRLEGEAYFEIAKDKAHPFTVESQNQEVEVLGTHFNINSYNDEPAIATTLLEGSVKVTAGSMSKTIVPGEQVENRGNSLSVSKANLETVTDWKDGEFNLQGMEFAEAMRKISRWYDVEVIYESTVSEKIKVGGWISRDSNLSGVLKAIERSGIVKFRIEDQKIYVSK